MADRTEAFEEELDGLEAAMAETSAVTAAFSSEISKMQGVLADTGKDAEVLSRGLSRGLRSAFDGVVFDSMKLSDALGTVMRGAVNAAYGAAVNPVAKQLGGLLAGGIAGLFADGASFAQGRVMPFASGGIVSGPTYFPMRGGTGLMGEAGPEAILPLARGADGKLGVRTGGGGAVSVTMNITTNDADSFRRSQSQIAAQMSRALSKSRRNG